MIVDALAIRGRVFLEVRCDGRLLVVRARELVGEASTRPDNLLAGTFGLED